MAFEVRRLGAEKKQKRHIRLPWMKILGVTLAVAQPLYMLGKRMHEKQMKAQRAKTLFSVSIAGAIGVTIVLLMFVFIVRLGMTHAPAIIQRSAGAPVSHDERGHTNILILGQGHAEHDGIDLTDTIIVASIDPKDSKTAVLLSLPRDLMFLNTENIGKRKKLNELWRDYRIKLTRSGMSYEEAALASMKEVAAEIGRALDIPIHHSVKVDFIAFEKIVDALGGVDVEVAHTIHDTEYPGPNYTYQTFHIDAGPQHLDGATALKYARSRHTTSDFDRSARQQQIISALIEKAKSAAIDPVAITQLYQILTEHILTDLSLGQLITLASVAPEFSRDRMVTMQLNDLNGLYGEQIRKGGLLYFPPRDEFGGVSVLLPVSIPEFPVTWKQVRMLSTLLFHHRHLYLDNPTFTVFNGGAPSGSAGRVYRELTKYGFEVVEVSNLPERTKVDTSFMVRTTDTIQETDAIFFSSLLSIPTTPFPDDIRSLFAEDATLGDSTIVLGRDFSFTFFQDFLDTLP